MAGGKYGSLDRYKPVLDLCDYVLCADRGADYAFKMGIVPDCIIGDMDSISPEVWEYYSSCQVEFKKLPPAQRLYRYAIGASGSSRYGS